MRNKSKSVFYLLIIFSLIFSTKIIAQTDGSIDSTKVRDFVIDGENSIGKTDTIAWVQGDSKLDNMTSQVLREQNKFQPSPKKAIIYSAIFPGLGQIYNRKYWKLPIIYGGFLGLTYAVSWNNKYYNDYSKAYNGIMSENPFEPSQLAKWQSFVRYGVDPNDLSESQIATLKSSFKRNKNSYRRNRDLSIIGIVALYALCMVDAYVDAELFDFDITPDLSLKVEPTVNLKDNVWGKNLGVQCSVSF